MSGEDWVQIYFDNVYVAPENVLLTEGGFKKQIAGFNVERIGNTARSLALGRYAYEMAREWALQRKQFGRLLCEFQGLQWKFADMKMKLDAGATAAVPRRGRTPTTAFRRPTRPRSPRPSATRPASTCATKRCRSWAAWATATNRWSSTASAACRGWMIAGGSIEILKNRIAEGVFDRSFPQRAGD